MYYVCIENGNVIGIQNYEPAVPPSVEVVSITDDDFGNITKQTHKFDAATKAVIPIDQSIKDKERVNAEAREFLRSTDWQVLRHIRQKALGQTTSLTEEEYLRLEQQRADAAARIE